MHCPRDSDTYAIYCVILIIFLSLSLPRFFLSHIDVPLPLSRMCFLLVVFSTKVFFSLFGSSLFHAFPLLAAFFLRFELSLLNTFLLFTEGLIDVMCTICLFSFVPVKKGLKNLCLFYFCSKQSQNLEAVVHFC
jgi:hypothetical protein